MDSAGTPRGNLAYYEDTNGWIFFTAASPTATDTSERLRITAAGDVGIGTSSPAREVHVQKAGAAHLPQLGGGL